MLTSEPIPARLSKTGHYGIQYPDFEKMGIIVPRNSELRELHWVGGGPYKAYIWERAEGLTIIWVEDSSLKTTGNLLYAHQKLI